MKKLKLLIAAIALTACNKAYNGSFENCKVVSTEFIKEHTVIRYRMIGKFWSSYPETIPDNWKVKALRNNQVVDVNFSTDPNLKTDSIYKLIILE